MLVGMKVLIICLMFGSLVVEVVSINEKKLNNTLNVFNDEKL